MENETAEENAAEDCHTQTCPKTGSHTNSTEWNTGLKKGNDLASTKFNCHNTIKNHMKCFNSTIPWNSNSRNLMLNAKIITKRLETPQIYI